MSTLLESVAELPIFPCHRYARFKNLAGLSTLRNECERVGSVEDRIAKMLLKRQSEIADIGDRLRELRDRIAELD